MDVRRAKAKPIPLVLEVVFWNRWRRRTCEGLADPGSPGIMDIKQK